MTDTIYIPQPALAATVVDYHRPTLMDISAFQEHKITSEERKGKGKEDFI